jgi:hypothetical protein
MRRIAIVYFGFAAVAIGQTGQIQGTVTDGSGTPISGAVVAASLKRAGEAIPLSSSRLPSFMPVPAKAPSSSTGGFQISGLYAGTYTLCVDVPNATYLNPCLWSSLPVTANVAEGATTSGVAVVTQKGVMTTIRVQDTQGWLTQNPANDDLRIGTYNGSSPFIFARVVGRDSNGRTMGIVTPVGQPLTVYVSSSKFTLADGNGNGLAASAQFPVAASAVSQSSPVVTVNVKGSNAGH